MKINYVKRLEKSEEAAFKGVCDLYGCHYIKFSALGFAGIPDRIVLCPGGKVLFLEWKRDLGEGETTALEPIQVYWAGVLKGLGFPAATVINSKQAKAALVALLKSEG